MNRTQLLVGSAVVAAVISGTATTSRAAMPDKPDLSLARQVLREASDLAMKRGLKDDLVQVARLQTLAGDLDGSFGSLKFSESSYWRDYAQLTLAEAIASTGDLNRALSVVDAIKLDYASRRMEFRDEVQLKWIEYQVGLGHLETASKAPTAIISDSSRAISLCELAQSYARSGYTQQATSLFKESADVAMHITGGALRTKDMLQLATAEMQTPGAAERVIDKLVQSVGSMKDPFDGIRALCGSARILAQHGNSAQARLLFARAVDMHKTVNEPNRLDSLVFIGIAEARAGFTRDGLELSDRLAQDQAGTASDARTVQSQAGHAPDAAATPPADLPWEQAELLCGVASIAAERGDIETAETISQKIPPSYDYRDHVYDKIVDRLIASKKLAVALNATLKITNPSARACAVLRVAYALAASGSTAEARRAAAGIVLERADNLSKSWQRRFDYREPGTWGFIYDDWFDISMRYAAIHRAELVATAAARLALVLHLKLRATVEDQFAALEEDSIGTAIARTYGSTGDPVEVVAFEHDVLTKAPTSANVNRRLAAIIGVAEGLLYRAGIVVPDFGPVYFFYPEDDYSFPW